MGFLRVDGVAQRVMHDKPAAYPTEYAKRAGELIARSVRSLHRLRQKN
jgi:hypothetical protein